MKGVARLALRLTSLWGLLMVESLRMSPGFRIARWLLLAPLLCIVGVVALMALGGGAALRSSLG